MLAFKLLYVVPTHFDHFIFIRKGGVQIVDTLQSEQHVALVHPYIGHGDRSAADVDGVELLQKVHRVAPRLDLQLAPDAEGVDDLSGFEKFFVHCRYPPFFTI